MIDANLPAPLRHSLRSSREVVAVVVSPGVPGDAGRRPAGARRRSRRPCRVHRARRDARPGRVGARDLGSPGGRPDGAGRQAAGQRGRRARRLCRPGHGRAGRARRDDERRARPRGHPRRAHRRAPPLLRRRRHDDRRRRGDTAGSLGSRFAAGRTASRPRPTRSASSRKRCSRCSISAAASAETRLSARRRGSAPRSRSAPRRPWRARRPRASASPSEAPPARSRRGSPSPTASDSSSSVIVSSWKTPIRPR